jgi:hypothetical protein
MTMRRREFIAALLASQGVDESLSNGDLMSKKAKAAKGNPKRKVKKGPAEKMAGTPAQRNKNDRTTPRAAPAGRPMTLGNMRELGGIDS